MKRHITVLMAITLIFALMLSGCFDSGPSGGPDAAGEPQKAAEQEEDYDYSNWLWELKIDDTQKYKQANQNVTMRLVVYCTKLGGGDPAGTYTGHAELTYNYSMSEGVISGDADGKGYDNDVKIVLGDYALHPLYYHIDTDQCHWADYGAFNMAGEGTVEARAMGAKWNTEGEGTRKLLYEIAVYSADVTLFVPDLAPGPFKGTVMYNLESSRKK